MNIIMKKSLNLTRPFISVWNMVGHPTNLCLNWVELVTTDF